MKVTRANALIIQPNKNTVVYSYPSNNKSISVAYIKVTGRHPANEGEYFIENVCHVIFYIIKGSGQVNIEGEKFKLSEQDTIVIEAGKKYYVEGKLEYVAATSPAYFAEQNSILK